MARCVSHVSLHDPQRRPALIFHHTTQTTLPVLENDFSQRVNAIVQKTREMRRGVYYPHLYVVKEDGEPPLRLWALSCLIQDRADVLPSYQQFISQLRDKVRLAWLRWWSLAMLTIGCMRIATGQRLELLSAARVGDDESEGRRWGQGVQLRGPRSV